MGSAEHERSLSVKVFDCESETSGRVYHTPAHVALAVVLQVRERELQVLLWQRAREPVRGRLGPARRQSRSRRDARGLDPPPPRGEGRRPRASPTSSSSRRGASPAGTRSDRELATAYLGLVPAASTRAAGGHGLARRRRAARSSRSTTARSCSPAASACAAKLSYTNVGFALAPATFTLSELRDLYAAALGHDVSATNLKRVLLRRGVLEPTGDRREPGRTGGRPAEVFRFRTRTARDHRPVRGAAPTRLAIPDSGDGCHADP